jgi:Ca2+-binding EF-hand superfamily protein
VLLLIEASGSIEFNEFLNAMGEQFYSQPSEQDLKDAFQAFDSGQYVLGRFSGKKLLANRFF